LLTWFRRSQGCQIQNISIHVYCSVFMKILAFKDRTKVALYINLEHRDIDM
jgi:hypothetical protein